MRDAHPIRYFLHGERKTELTNADGSLKPNPHVTTLDDLRSMGRDFYAEQYVASRDGIDGVLITPVPFDGKIASTKPDFANLEIVEISDSLSICYEPDCPPDFADLLRPDFLSGYELSVKGFSHKLKIPIARSPIGKDSLAKSYVFKFPNGSQFESDEKIETRHQPLFDWATEYFKSYAGESEMPQSRAVEIAVKVVAWNYRIGPLESNLFHNKLGRGIFTTASVRDILFCLIDGPNMPTEENTEPQKKT